MWNGFLRKRVSHSAGFGTSMQLSGQKLWRFRGIYQISLAVAVVTSLLSSLSCGVDARVVLPALAPHT